MVEIPENEVTVADISAWYKAAAELAKLKAYESMLRHKIAKARFPSIKEGTNSSPLDDGYLLKAKHQINRDVDFASFVSNKPRFLEKLIKVDEIIKYKPELVLSEYRTLTEEQRQMFDECLIIKPGATSLEITLPKKKGTVGSLEIPDIQQ